MTVKIGYLRELRKVPLAVYLQIFQKAVDSGILGWIALGEVQQIRHITQIILGEIVEEVRGDNVLVSLGVPVGGPGGGCPVVCGIETLGPVVYKFRGAVRAFNGQGISLDHLIRAVAAGLIKPLKIFRRNRVRVQHELFIQSEAVGKSGVVIVIEVQAKNCMLMGYQV